MWHKILNNIFVKNQFLVGFVLILALNGAEKNTVIIHSNTMDKDLPCIVILPDNYTVSTDRFSVVYLLHGYGGNYQNWSEHKDLGKESDKYNLIIVCPDGGTNSWYLDSPIDLESQYRTYVGQEVVQYIDMYYKTIPDKHNRAITGLSMGGHGALYLALEFPDIFGAVGSMSGVVDLTYTTKKYELIEKIGSFEKYPERWEQYSVISNVEKFIGTGTKIIMDCGVDDVFIESNRASHKKLLELEISHDYSEKPGGHSWNYWVNILDYHLMAFQKFFQP
ncbi:MAG: alpha/beta hydrolase [Fidelibacterota bacterium]